MKPVDLTPRGGSVTETPSSGPQLQVVGSVLGAVLVTCVGGYFMMASVDTVKEEAVAAREETVQVQAEAASVQQQIDQEGQKPVEQSWETVAAAYRQDLIQRVGDRADYTRLLRDLSIVLPPGAWFDDVSAGASTAAGAAAPSLGAGGAGAEESKVTLSGYAPTTQDVNSLVSNVNSTETMDAAEVGEISTERTQGGQPYRKFTITATLELGQGGDAAGADPNDPLVGSTVAPAELSLESAPGYTQRTKQKAAKAAKAAKARQLTPLEKLVRDTTTYGGPR